MIRTASPTRTTPPFPPAAAAAQRAGVHRDPEAVVERRRPGRTTGSDPLPPVRELLLEPPQRRPGAAVAGRHHAPGGRRRSPRTAPRPPRTPPLRPGSRHEAVLGERLRRPRPLGRQLEVRPESPADLRGRQVEPIRDRGEGRGGDHRRAGGAPRRPGSRSAGPPAAAPGGPASGTGTPPVPRGRPAGRTSATPAPGHARGRPGRRASAPAGRRSLRSPLRSNVAADPVHPRLRFTVHHRPVRAEQREPPVPRQRPAGQHGGGVRSPPRRGF